MAISFVGSLPPVGANNGGNVTLTFSNLRDSANAAVTLEQGDVIIAAYATSGTADFAMVPMSAGWTEIAQTYANGTIDTNLAVYYKVMGASPDLSVVFDGPGGSSNGTIGVAMAFRGLDAAVLDVTTPTPATGTATSRPDAPSITPAGSGAWPLVVGAGVAGAGAAFTNTDLSSTTNHFRSANHAETNDVAIGMGFKTDWTSGAFNPAVWGGGSVNASNSWAAITLALKQASTPTSITVTAASTSLSAQTVGINARSDVDVVSGVVTEIPQSLTISNITSTTLMVLAASTARVAQSLTINSKTVLENLAAQVSLTAAAITINAKYRAAVTAGSVTLAGLGVAVGNSAIASECVKLIRLAVGIFI